MESKRVHFFAFDYFQRETDFKNSWEFAYEIVISFTGVVLIDMISSDQLICV